VKKATGTTVVHVRFPNDVLELIKQYAEREQRTDVSAIVHLTTRMLAVVTPRLEKSK
jgi:hypothetical protein